MPKVGIGRYGEILRRLLNIAGDDPSMAARELAPDLIAQAQRRRNVGQPATKPALGIALAVDIGLDPRRCVSCMDYNSTRRCSGATPGVG